MIIIFGVANNLFNFYYLYIQIFILINSLINQNFKLVFWKNLFKVALNSIYKIFEIKYHSLFQLINVNMIFLLNKIVTWFN